MIYLASPYSHPDDAIKVARMRAACAAAADLIRKGHAVFSPIAQSHTICEEAGAPNTHEFWMPVDLHILRKCDEVRVLALPGWEKSRGVQEEIAHAYQFGIPVSYILPHEAIDTKGEVSPC